MGSPHAPPPHPSPQARGRACSLKEVQSASHWSEGFWLQIVPSTKGTNPPLLSPHAPATRTGIAPTRDFFKSLLRIFGGFPQRGLVPALRSPLRAALFPHTAPFQRVAPRGSGPAGSGVVPSPQEDLRGPFLVPGRTVRIRTVGSLLASRLQLLGLEAGVQPRGFSWARQPSEYAFIYLCVLMS